MLVPVDSHSVPLLYVATFFSFFTNRCDNSLPLRSPVDGVFPNVESFVPHQQLCRAIAPPHEAGVALPEGRSVVSQLGATEVTPLVPPADNVGRELELVRFLRLGGRASQGGGEGKEGRREEHARRTEYGKHEGDKRETRRTERKHVFLLILCVAQCTIVCIHSLYRMEIATSLKTADETRLTEYSIPSVMLTYSLDRCSAITTVYVSDRPVMSTSTHTKIKMRDTHKLRRTRTASSS